MVGLSPCGQWMKILRFPSWHRAVQRHNAVKLGTRGTSFSFVKQCGPSDVEPVPSEVAAKVGLIAIQRAIAICLCNAQNLDRWGQSQETEFKAPTIGVHVMASLAELERELTGVLSRNRRKFCRKTSQPAFPPTEPIQHGLSCMFCPIKSTVFDLW